MAIVATAAAISTGTAVAAGTVAFTFGAIATSFAVNFALGAAMQALAPKPTISVANR